MLPSTLHPLAASLNISCDIRRKASEAAAEETTRNFHQCKRVADWLRLAICDSLIGCVWNVSIQKSRFLLDYECCLHYRSGSKNKVFKKKIRQDAI